jgi:O-antigen/teichoic acid export membrane protein
MGRFLDLKTLGLFQLASKAVQIPSVFIGENIQKVFEQRTLKYKGNFKDKLALSIKVISYQFLISIFFAGLLYLSALYLFPKILPSKWQNSIEYMVLLSPLLITSIPSNSIFSMYKIFNFVQVFNKMEILENLVKLGVIILFAYAEETRSVVLSYVWFSILFALIKLTIIYILALKRSRN